MHLIVSPARCTPSTYQILRKPDPTIWIDVDADTAAMQRGTGQMNIMPAGRPLVHHAFLHGVHVIPWRCGWPCQPDIFTAIRKARESLIGNAHALIFPIGAGVAEAAVIHVPAMQPRTSRQRNIPGERVESSDCAIMIDQCE